VLYLRGPKDLISYGEIVDMAARRELDTSQPNYDVARFEFETIDDLKRAGFEKFLGQHYQGVAGAPA